MRGKVCRGVCGATGLGITPAYAGKRAVSRASWSFSWDHPRVCGEKKMPDNPATIKKGITPAYAGKRRCWAGCKLLVWDHPRVCGEKTLCPGPYLKSKGSPPRVRGKGGDGLSHAALEGITPAYAGKSKTRPLLHHLGRDHPRVCGEKCPPGKFFFMTVGSPPRMRGKVHQHLCGLVGLGITPAYAGKSVRRR